MSAESGIKTFRDANGLWEGHDVMEVASPQGWAQNRALVLEFYNQRRRQLLTVNPNAAHHALVELEEFFEVCIITQNVDDLHERAGSSQVLHLHGELLKARSTVDDQLEYEWRTDLKEGDTCEKGAQLRPAIVWFGEAVPMLDRAITEVATADVVIIIGTSMQVYPAAGLVEYAPAPAPVYFIDPSPAITADYISGLEIIAAPATIGVPQVVERLIDAWAF